MNSSGASRALARIWPNTQTVCRGSGVRALCIAAVLFIFFLWPGKGRMAAQSTFGSIRGVITDQTGAAVPDATIMLRSVDQATAVKAVSDASGAFGLQNLKPGRYILSVAHNGFASTQLQPFLIDARQELRMPVTMQVASTTDTIYFDSGS